MKSSTVIMCLAALALCAGSVAASARAVDMFQDYCTKYGRTYTSEEWDARMLVFHSNLMTIDALNRANGKPAYGVNQFTDMHPEEFRSRYLGYKPAAKRADLLVWEADSASAIADHKDWRDDGVITPVKNQAQCGSCWAFSTTEEIESRWAQAGHKLIELSVQQIVSCDNVDQGCNGGDTVTAYQYVEKAGGLELGSKYPYTSGGGDSGNCHFDKHAVVANITGYKWVTKNSDETAMKKFIANEGPISTCVDASTWQFYTGGVITSNCGRSLDHCVQTVGYNHNQQDGAYWIVRNSWGPSWGEQGYLYIQIGSDLCGIADEPTFVECPSASG